MTGLIKFQDVYRDAIQSLFGTNPSADEIITAYQDSHLTGVDSIQVAGGTFFDLFAKKGRDEWAELEKITGFFKGKGVKLSALIRGDFLFTYEPQSYDVIRATVFEHAKLGINILQNFHGMNDARCLVGVAKAVKEAQESGYDIVAQGTICIEDNPNITIENCLEFAQELVDMGHQGFYLKSASGRLDPEFVRELTSKLLDKFPDQEITIHAHSTYGEAPVCYMAAIEEATERGRPITIDVQHPAMAGSTAHPSMLKMLSLIKNHPFQFVKDNAPTLNIKAIKESMKSLLELRFLYRDFESKYNRELLESMRGARAAGGASATLKAIPGLEANLARLLGTDDWNQIQIAIYKTQTEILDDLGQPTQVTPYAANTTGQAAVSLASMLAVEAIDMEGETPEDKEKRVQAAKYSILYPGIINYLVGRHGRVPDAVNKELQEKALKQAGLEESVEYVLSTDRDPALGDAKEKLKEAGIEDPTDRQAISLAITGNIEHVVACYNGTNTPQEPPALPVYAQEPSPIENRHHTGGVPVRNIQDAVHAIGGRSELQHIALSAEHLKQLIDRLYKFPPVESCMESEWYEGNVQKLSELLNNINEKLKAAGFVTTQILSNELRADNLLACIKDSCDHRGEGVYKCMIGAIEDLRTGKIHDFGFESPAYSAHGGASQAGVDGATAAPQFK